MKKCLFTVLLTISLIMTAGAQEKLLSLGVKAGLNFASASDFLSQVENDKIKGRTDFIGGIFAELRPTSKISVSAEVLYSKQGYVQEGTHAGAPFSTTVKLDYINIPVLANIYLIDGLALKAGIQYGIKANVDVSLTEGVDWNLEESFKNADFSIPIGLSYNFDFGLIVDARYNIGISDITVSEIAGQLLSKTRNSVFTVTLGYRF